MPGHDVRVNLEAPLEADWEKAVLGCSWATHPTQASTRAQPVRGLAYVE
jgi:hypothetical protein